MKANPYCMFENISDHQRQNLIQELARLTKRMTGRFRFSYTLDRRRTTLYIELFSPMRWQEDILAHPRFREVTYGIDDIRFCLEGYTYTKSRFRLPYPYEHGVRLPFDYATGEFCRTVKSNESELAASEWTAPRMTPKGLDEFERLGLEDYRLGHDWVERPRADGSKRWFQAVFAVFAEFDQYALAKLRF